MRIEYPLLQGSLRGLVLEISPMNEDDLLEKRRRSQDELSNSHANDIPYVPSQLSWIVEPQVERKRLERKRSRLCQKRRNPRIHSEIEVGDSEM